MSNTPTFQDAPFAFNEAIASGRLSTDKHAANYAGHFMYMGTVDGLDQFKNITTRQYINRVGEYDEVRSNWSRRANLANVRRHTALNS